MGVVFDEIRGNVVPERADSDAPTEEKETAKPMSDMRSLMRELALREAREARTKAD